MAKKYAVEKTWNDVLISNQENEWIESSSSNVYVVKNNKIYTPKLESGCVSGVCRSFLLNHFDINFVSIDSEVLIDADEIFLSNGVNLIQPVLFLEQKQLETTQTKQLISSTKKLLQN